MVDPSDLLIATCEAPDAADPWIVVTVGLEHLLSLGGGYVQPACAPSTCGPASIPREACRPDPGRPPLVATCGARPVVGPRVVETADPE